VLPFLCVYIFAFYELPSVINYKVYYTNCILEKNKIRILKKCCFYFVCFKNMFILFTPKKRLHLSKQVLNIWWKRLDRVDPKNERERDRGRGYLWGTVQVFWFRILCTRSHLRIHILKIYDLIWNVKWIFYFFFGRCILGSIKEATLENYW